MSPDEAEASAIRYNVARIVRLSSGAFALFSPYADGIELLAIGSLEEIGKRVPTAAEVGAWCDDRTAERKRLDEFERREATTLLEALGLAKPQAKFERRF